MAKNLFPFLSNLSPFPIENIQEENPHKPELHYVGNMHGNEVVGRELLLRFIGYYLDTYKSQTEEGEKRAECAHPIVRLMEETVLYVIPSMNPDGFELGRRENGLSLSLFLSLFLFPFFFFCPFLFTTFHQLTDTTLIETSLINSTVFLPSFNLKTWPL